MCLDFESLGAVMTASVSPVKRMSEFDRNDKGAPKDRREVPPHFKKRRLERVGLELSEDKPNPEVD